MGPQGNLEIGGVLTDKVVSKIKVVWYRKFGFFTSYEGYKYLSKNITNNEDNFKFLSNMRSEYLTIKEYILFKLENKKWLAKPQSVSLNKLIVLEDAKKCGLRTPETLLLNKKEMLNEIDGSIVTKPASKGFSYGTTDNHIYKTYTTRLQRSCRDYFPSVFFPSVVQKEIKKDFEIRSFFLIDHFYSMAIFSQKNEKTEVDFRNYDFKNPNRRIPYKLPSIIEKKLKLLFRKLELNTGSVDLIKGCDGNFYFLEINPCGQFGMVEAPCNYSLHKQVAIELIKMNAHE